MRKDSLGPLSSAGDQAKQRSGSEIVAAITAILPLSIAVIPWGILTGALAVEAGFSPLQAQCLSLLVFAGAAQISAVSMVSTGVPVLSIFGSTAVISARHLLYSVVFRSHLQTYSRPLRVLIAFVLTDEMFVVSEANTRRTGHFSYQFALISGFTFYVVWNLATLVGILAGEYLGNLDSWGLDFAIVATFIAMTFDQLKGRPEVVTVFVSGLVAVVLKPVFSDSYIILAAMAGMLSGYFLADSAVKKPGEAES